MSSPTLREVRASARNRARDARIDPREIDLLLGDVLGWTITQLIAHDDVALDDETLRQFDALLQRRLSGEPVQYIRRQAEFYSRSFAVDERVLIPRPETEILVEAALQMARRNSSVLDVGTGSGCIALSLALERPDLHVTASDKSIEALAVAQQNTRRHRADLTLIASDGLSALRSRYELVVSNPPYIAESDVVSLQVEVRDHEPKAALTPGSDPLRMIERLFSESRNHLHPGGRLLLEIGYGQAEAVRRLAAEHGWRVEQILNDLAAIPRVVISSPAR